MKTFRFLSGLAVALCAFAFGSAPQAADFYKGKRITLYVAASPGGGYASYARAIARHWNRHIPGDPRFVVKHKQGAQGLVAASYLANKSRRDGTEILASYREAVTTSALTAKSGVRFDATKFGYIGSADQGYGVCVAAKRINVKSLEDAKKKPVRLGATHHRSLGYSSAYFLNNMFGTQFQVYHGYPAGSSIVLALERGEVDARCGWSESSLKTMKPTWMEGKMVNILLQLSLTSHPQLKGVPLVKSFAKTDEQRQLLNFILTPQSVGRPYIAPPGLPKARLELLRTSFMAVLKDKTFLKDAKKQRIDINPVTGAELDVLIANLFKTDKKLIERALEVTTKSTKVKLVKVKIPWLTNKVKVSKVKRRGRRVSFKAGGHKVTVKVSKSKTKITIAGKKAKRSAVKAGMTCAITHKGSKSRAKSIKCD
ncbi:MAG: Bug family tripartite tricarboxylate transporter substrate binding protein [Alphaproteobacteria bacterium]